MFDTVLVANRGEIAVRVIRTLRALGVRAVAVYSDADADAAHVRAADAAVRLGPAPPRDSYLRADALLAAAAATGAQAVHPGYGFLSENAAFAAACAAAGLVFVGPPPAAIEAMGDKIRARRTVAAAGVPVVPGCDDPAMDDAALAAAAVATGFPVLLKPSAGGGGKGMRLVESAAGLPAAIASARREAAGAFGDDTLFVERFVARPRHVEVQVLADAHGGVVHLGERECSLQRRHQKVVEEAPSPLLDAAGRARMGAAAVDAARAVGYTGAGTVEFIVAGDDVDQFFFMEMNTRLQVEHPVTEAVTGVDLVEWQLRVAAGEPLGFDQPGVRLTGHAVEARVYAEDPARGFLPTGGTVLALREPSGPGVRVDSALAVGAEVSTTYDPMLAKVVAHGPDRPAALARLSAALRATSVLGVGTNTAFLVALLADPDVRAGRLDTGLVERRLADLAPGGAPDHVLAAAGLERLLAAWPAAGADPWDVPDGWRLGEPAWATWRLGVDGHADVEVSVRGRPDDARVRLAPVGTAGAADADPDPGLPARARLVPDAAGPGGGAGAGATLHVSLDGVARSYHVARAGSRLWLSADGGTWAVDEQPFLAAAAHSGTGGDGRVSSPMPGTVVAVEVAEGQRVDAGQPLVVVEAMKMEHTLTAPCDGAVSGLSVRTGDAVRLDQLLLRVVPATG